MSHNLGFDPKTLISGLVAKGKVRFAPPATFAVLHRPKPSLWKHDSQTRMKVRRLRETGMTWNEVSAKTGVKPETARSIYKTGT